MGLALGNLGQYHANGSDEENNSSDEEEDDEDGSDGSSGDGDDEPRTMNLFAGNMDNSDDGNQEASAQELKKLFHPAERPFLQQKTRDSQPILALPKLKSQRAMTLFQLLSLDRQLKPLTRFLVLQKRMLSY